MTVINDSEMCVRRKDEAGSVPEISGLRYLGEYRLRPVYWTYRRPSTRSIMVFFCID